MTPMLDRHDHQRRREIVEFERHHAACFKKDSMIVALVSVMPRISTKYQTQVSRSAIKFRSRLLARIDRSGRQRRATSLPPRRI
jgi:hypothetical protein